MGFHCIKETQKGKVSLQDLLECFDVSILSLFQDLCILLPFFCLICIREEIFPCFHANNIKVSGRVMSRKFKPKAKAK